MTHLEVTVKECLFSDLVNSKQTCIYILYSTLLTTQFADHSQSFTEAAMQGADLLIRSSIKFSVSPKDTFTCNWLIWGSNHQ